MLWYFITCFILTVIAIEYSFYKIRTMIEYDATLKPGEFPPWRRQDIARWSRLRLYVGGTLFMVPRVWLILVGLVWQWFFCCIAIAGADSSKPLSSSRRSIIQISSRIFPRLFLLGAGFWWIKKEGTPPDPKAAVVVSNHCTWVDIMVLLVSDELPSFLSSDWVSKMPFVGTIARCMQCVFVDRSNEESRAKVTEQLIQR